MSGTMESPAAVTITGMRLINAEKRRDGSKLVATFESIFPTFRLAGCVIVLDMLGQPMAYPPEARSRTKDLPPVTITDPNLRCAMQRKAVRLYEAMADETAWSHPPPAPRQRAPFRPHRPTEQN
jgi:hypothetical protein